MLDFRLITYHTQLRCFFVFFFLFDFLQFLLVIVVMESALFVWCISIEETLERIDVMILLKITNLLSSEVKFVDKEFYPFWSSVYDLFWNMSGTNNISMNIHSFREVFVFID